MRNRPDYSAVIHSETVGWGYTCAERLFPDLQARGLGLQFKYRDSFAGKISERSKVNGQKLAWSTVKPPKRAGQSGHMEKQETEMKRKLETETGNGNWKWKPETNGNKRRTNHWCNVFFIACLALTGVFYT